MTKSQIQQMSQGMSDLYTGLETDLISNIADYLKSGDIYSSTAQWKIQMLAQLGALDKANIKTISNYAGMSPSLLSQALEMASLTAINELEGGFRQLVKDGIINGTNVPVMDTMERTLKLYNKQAKNSLNMVNTVMLYKAKSITGKIINQTAEIANKPEYIAMLSKATGKFITGIESRQSAMRQCIQEMTAKGIPAFVDKLGREWSPEAYINMNIRTTLSNTANTAQMERMSDYGISLVEVSSHSGARPKCAKYQGRIFDKSNKSQKYPHWKDTSYGQPDGLLGINCGHQIYPYIEGVSVQRYFPYNKDTNDKAYRLSQHQRELERRVRKSKRECMVLEKLGDDKGLKRASATLKNRKQALEKFSSANNLPVRTDRTAVVGYNKSIAGKVKNSLTSGSSGGKLKDIVADIEINSKYYKGKATLFDVTEERIMKTPEVVIEGLSSELNKKLYEAQKELLKSVAKEELGTEYAYTFNMNMEKINFVKGTSNKHSVSIQRETEDCIIIHNHPDNLPFSPKDFETFAFNSEIRILGAVGHNGNVYYLEKTDEFDSNQFDFDYYNLRKKYGWFDEKGKYHFNSNDDIFNFIDEIFTGGENNGFRTYVRTD